MEGKIHSLKTWNPYFQDVLFRKKNFELRRNDRDFKIGDELCLEEYDPKTKTKTGRITRRTVLYIIEGGNFGLEKGYCILGF